MNPLRMAVCVSITLGVFCQPGEARPKRVTFQVPGATATVPRTITNRGEVAGFFVDGTGQHGFLRATDGTFTIVDVPGAANTDAVAVRRDGTIVGNYSKKTDQNTFYTRGFVRTPDGQYMDVMAPHAAGYTSAVSLDKAGWIAGTGIRGRHGDTFGFLRNPRGHYTEFGEQLTVACANSHQTIAGTLSANGAIHGFVRTPDGTITQFDPPRAVYTVVSAINDAGVVIGYFKSSSGINEGFIRAADGTISTFAVPGKNVQGTGPLSINEDGAIAGYYQNRINQGGFVRAADGNLKTIDVPRGKDTEINSINDKGQLAGEFKTNGIVMGFIWKP